MKINIQIETMKLGLFILCPDLLPPSPLPNTPTDLLLWLL